MCARSDALHRCPERPSHEAVKVMLMLQESPEYWRGQSYGISAKESCRHTIERSHGAELEGQSFPRSLEFIGYGAAGGLGTTLLDLGLVSSDLWSLPSYISLLDRNGFVCHY